MVELFLTDIFPAGIRRPTQDPSLSGGSCPGAGGRRYRGWPGGCPARVWSHQVGCKNAQMLLFWKVSPSIEFDTNAPLCFSYVVVMPNKRQALVEYEDMNGSSTAVTYAADNQVYIAGHPAFINYSTSKKISRPGDSDDSRSVNNVLLFTIMNPIYPITTVTEAGECGEPLFHPDVTIFGPSRAYPIQPTKHPCNNRPKINGLVTTLKEWSCRAGRSPRKTIQLSPSDVFTCYCLSAFIWTDLRKEIKTQCNYSVV